MSSERSPEKDSSPEERRQSAYISPSEGYRPAQQQANASEDSPHPLHLIYRKRIRGIRQRWLASGVLLGLLVGVILTLAASALVVSQIPSLIGSLNGTPDIAVVIGEAYLNREADSRLKEPLPVGGQFLKLTALNIDLKSGNRMDLRPTFTAAAGPLSFQFGATVINQLSVQDGNLVLNMVGDPQLGSLNLPLEMLPFDLKGEVRKAVDKINNDMLIAEINSSLQVGLGDSQFGVEGVTTTEDSLSVSIKHK